MNELVEIKNNQIQLQQEVVQKIKEFNKLKKEMEYQEKLLKQGLMEAMVKLGIQNFATDGISASIKSGYIRHSVDTTALKKEMPEIYNQFLKDTEVKATITLTIGD